MRIPASKQLRVGRGDVVTVSARLISPDANLGRLYVFAKEGDYEFSPYVPSVANVASDGSPLMQTPLHLRLLKGYAARQLTFVTDFDGHVVVMQEIDQIGEPLAKVRLKRQINRNLPWMQRLSRRLSGLFR